MASYRACLQTLDKTRKMKHWPMLSVTPVYMEQYLRCMDAVGGPFCICLCIRKGLDRAVER